MGRRFLVSLVVGVTALALAPVAATWADTSAPPSVQAVSQGWWSEFSGAGAGAIPGNPLAGVAPPVTEPAPDVPDGVIPVALRFGQVDRVAAIGITFDGAQGASVNKLVLHLKEATQSGAQQGSGAAVRACPISDFLQPEANGQAANIPKEDCTVAHADGVRADDGTWTFDLTDIAKAWASGAVTVNGIRFDPVGSLPGTFQVGFTGYKDATFDADIAAGTGGANDAFASPDTSSSDAFAGGGSLGSTLPAGDYSSPAASAPAPSVAAPPAAAAPRRPPTTVPAAARKRAGGTFGDSPLATILLIAGLAALALAAAWALGAGGRATDEQLVRRQGGVSRALGTRARTEELHA